MGSLQKLRAARSLRHFGEQWCEFAHMRASTLVAMSVACVAATSSEVGSPGIAGTTWLGGRRTSFGGQALGAWWPAHLAAWWVVRVTFFERRDSSPLRKPNLFCAKTEHHLEGMTPEFSRAPARR